MNRRMRVTRIALRRCVRAARPARPGASYTLMRHADVSQRMADAGLVTSLLDVDVVLNSAVDITYVGYEHRETVVHGWPTSVSFQPSSGASMRSLARSESSG